MYVLQASESINSIINMQSISVSFETTFRLSDRDWGF